MAVAAINAIVSHVLGVADLKRLLDELVGARDMRGAPQDDQKTDEAVGDKQAVTILTFERVLTDLRESVGAATDASGTTRSGRVRQALTSPARREGHESRPLFLLLTIGVVPRCEKRIKPRAVAESLAKPRDSVRQPWSIYMPGPPFGPLRGSGPRCVGTVCRSQPAKRADEFVVNEAGLCENIQEQSRCLV